MIAVGIGGLGVAGGVWSLRFPQKAQRFCRELPQNEEIGRVLMLINVVWSLILFNQMDLGGWNRVKPVIYALSPLIYWFIIRYVNNYLGARSLAWFLILVAKPVVKICYLRSEPSSLVLTTLAYIWVIMGIIFFSVPHWFRDWMAFWQANPNRWTWGCRSKVVLGCGLIALGIFIY